MNAAPTSSAPTPAELRDRFRRLHDGGCFVIPNPFDVGSARILEQLGFPALATTSSGFAATLGRHDQHVTRDELVGHVAAICAAVSIPVNVDAERCYADDLDGIGATIELLAGAGAAGISIEDYDPVAGAVDSIDRATERVAAAVEACRRHGIVLTARAENHLYGAGDLDDTVERLRRYVGAGAEVAYAPGFFGAAEIERLASEVPAPLNVLALPGVPSVAELAAAGVRRVSTGGSLTWAAYGGLVAAATELRDLGTTTFQTDGYRGRPLAGDLRAAAFASRPPG